MRGVVFENYKTFPVLRDDLKKPEPGPGEVLLKEAGAGACHSDVAIFQNFDEGVPGAQKPPFILGHESSGWVEEVGAGVNGFKKGDAYLIYDPIGCQHCKACSRVRTRTARTHMNSPTRASAWGGTAAWRSTSRSPPATSSRCTMRIRSRPRRWRMLD